LQGIGPHCTAVIEILQDLQPLGDDVVALDALQMGDETDAAGVVFELGTVETGRWRRFGHGQAFLDSDPMGVKRRVR